jgi:tRNA(fMet)-specific endonuclease VapC
VFIALERQRLDLSILVRLLPNQAVTVAAITASELQVGVYYADAPERRQWRQEFVNRVLVSIPAIPFDFAAVCVYARLLVDLRRSGHTVGAHDLQIAAIALDRGFEVAAHNVRDFHRVPGLTVRRVDSLGS